MRLREPYVPDLSLVIPVFNERDSLEQLYEEISRACSGPLSKREIIFVDDGSSDGSAECLDALARRDSSVRVVHLRRNFGKSPALAAGFERARGKVVVTMDADLQDDPAMIPVFLQRIDAGADLVSGWKQRRHDPLDKTLPSRLFNGVVRRLSGVNLRDFNCGFKAYRAECLKELRVYGGFHRFLPWFAHDRGFRVEELVVQHRARVHGHSKFGSKRLLEGLLDLPTVLLLTRFRTRPLHFFGMPGLLLMLLGFLLLSYLGVVWLAGESVGTRPLLTLGVLLTLGGGQFVGVGLIGEIVVRGSLGQRDVYAVREVRSEAASLSSSDAVPMSSLARFDRQ